MLQTTNYSVSQWMSAGHGMLNWVMSVGSLICKLVCVLFDELSVIVIPTQIRFLRQTSLAINLYEENHTSTMVYCVLRQAT